MNSSDISIDIHALEEELLEFRWMTLFVRVEYPLRSSG